MNFIELKIHFEWFNFEWCELFTALEIHKYSRLFRLLGNIAFDGMRSIDAQMQIAIQFNAAYNSTMYNSRFDSTRAYAFD